MPTFFEGLKRVIQGKPVFDLADSAPPDHTRDDFLNQAPVAASTPVAGPVSTIQKGIAGTFPEVHVHHTHSHHHDGTLEIRCSIKNSWHDAVDVDKIHLLDMTRDIRMSLQPGEEREVLVYSGPVLTSQRGSEAKLDYKTKTGDYFEAIHEVRYTFTPDKTYEVTELKLRLPIRDIWG